MRRTCGSLLKTTSDLSVDGRDGMGWGWFASRGCLSDCLPVCFGGELVGRLTDRGRRSHLSMICTPLVSQVCQCERGPPSRLPVCLSISGVLPPNVCMYVCPPFPSLSLSVCPCHVCTLRIHALVGALIAPCIHLSVDWIACVWRKESAPL